MKRPGARGWIGLALAVAGCSVTWRQPEIQPLDPTRQYAVPLQAACDAVDAALASLELAVPDATREESGCLLQTDHRQFPESGEEVNYLRKVAWVTPGDFFAHGRFTVTATARPASGDLTRVRLTTRIEGYDAGYRLLRSRGLIEDALFARIEEQLGVGPAQ